MMLKLLGWLMLAEVVGWFVQEGAPRIVVVRARCKHSNQKDRSAIFGARLTGQKSFSCRVKRNAHRASR